MDCEEIDNPQDTPQPAGGWVSAHYRKSKCVLVPEGHDGVASPPSLNSKLHSKRTRPPPLPRQDYKVVLRSHEGLNLSQWKPHHVAQGIALACNNHPRCAENRPLVRTILTKNVAVISPPHTETADILRKLAHIKLAGKDHAVFAYVAAPDNSVKGVIHGIEPGTQPSELQAHLRARNHRILYARMLGQTQTVVITFEGARVPHYVYYYGAETRCFPERSTRQVCTICLRVGHRADVCPNPETNRCPQCGQASPREDHDCKPTCAICKATTLRRARHAQHDYESTHTAKAQPTTGTRNCLLEFCDAAGRQSFHL
ncbi:hypothetical protein HPB48_001483 [Haemaphysalis longicornis]|uniref:Uncharacterized protein n=1 Tax=Haemaphysalis longicornis TaxID=44386 RepID=A0A9J6F7A8_HAELO|nr:hypothetical protein HPB48_001483 [Haemaphysalis longicornis]